ncbi:MAG: HAD family hydrolase [Deltaproteobacteria bacterium]|nr:MAG: HAD family hydrolase [Deltaproteobacteria bacterium]
MAGDFQIPELLLVDLDGTLIDVDMQSFIPAWLSGIAGRLSDAGQAAAFPGRARLAIRRLLEPGDGHCCNDQRFFTAMNEDGGFDPDELRWAIDRFCRDGMRDLAGLVRPVAGVGEFLGAVASSGVKLVLATNPVFPEEAIRARMAWGGLEADSFDLVTDWGNSRHCKPEAGYFLDILDQFGVSADRALMVGNDTGHDMAAGRVGMGTFLVDTHLVERTPDWPADRRGSLVDLARLLGGGDGIF